MNGSGCESVRVAGEAWRAIPPDRAIWRIGVRERDGSEAAAYERCVEHAQTVAAEVRAVLGEDGAVWTSGIELTPLLVEERPDGYEAECSVVSEGPAETAGRIAGTALSHGASYLGGPRLSLSTLDHTREELLTEAVRDARNKAESLAFAAGRRCGRVLSIAEANGNSGSQGEPDLASANGNANGLHIARVRVWLEVELTDTR